MRSPGAFVTASLLALLLEVAFFPQLPGAPRAHLPLLVACSAGLVYGPRQGVSVGVLSGLLVDLWIGRLIGSSALLYAGAGWLAGLLGQGLYRDVPGLSPATGAVATFTVETLRVVLAGMASGREAGVAAAAGWPGVLVPDVLVAAVMAPLVFRAVLWIERRERAARSFGAVPGSPGRRR